jgi:hypothetical protein
MGVKRRAHNLNARHIDGTEKQAVLAALQFGLHDHCIGQIVTGDMPFFAGDEIMIAVANGRGLDGAGIRACIFLGDGIAQMHFTAGRGQDIALHLIGVAGLKHPTLDFAIAPAERIGHPAELLNDGHLGEQGQGQSAQ